MPIWEINMLANNNFKVNKTRIMGSTIIKMPKEVVIKTIWLIINILGFTLDHGA